MIQLVWFVEMALARNTAKKGQ